MDNKYLQVPLAAGSNSSTLEYFWLPVAVAIKGGDKAPDACNPIVLVVKTRTLALSTTPILTSSSPPGLSAESSTSTTSSSSSCSSTSSSFGRDLLAEATQIIQSKSYQPFCSSLLTYSTPTVTTTAMTVTEMAAQSTTVIDGVGTITQTFISIQSTNVSSIIVNMNSTPSTTMTTIITVAVTVTMAAKILRAGRLRHVKLGHVVDANPNPIDLIEHPASAVTTACSLMASPISETFYINATARTAATPSHNSRLAAVAVDPLLLPLSKIWGDLTQSV